MKLELECLESRDAPASFSLNDGVLTFVGTAANEAVTVRDMRFNGPKIYATVNTQQADGSWVAVSQLFDAASVTSVVADLGDGNDSFSNYSARLPSLVFGGGGDDRFYASSRNPDTFIGGAGNDTYYLGAAFLVPLNDVFVQ